MSSETNETEGAPTSLAVPGAVGLVAIVALAVALRAWRLGERSVWFDEAFSWRLATFSWGEMLHRTTQDNNPPLYYALLKVWMACFGDSPVALRSLSALAGALSCVGTYLMIVEAYARSGNAHQRRVHWIGLFAAALVAVTALQIRWGWEARMYALGAALAPFSSWLLLRALRAPLGARPSQAAGLADSAGARAAGRAVALGEAWRPWMLYALVALAFAYTHTYALLSLIAQALFTAGYLLVEARWRPAALFANRRFRIAVVGFFLIAAGWLPWLPVLLRQRAQVREAYWLGPLTRWTVPNICRQMFADPEARTTNDRDAGIAAVACAAVLLALFRRPRAGDWFLLASVGVPVGLAVAISAADGNILQVRYFVFTQVFLLAALARMVGRITHWPERTIVGAVVLGSLLLLHVEFLDRLDVPGIHGLRAAAEHVAARRKPGEPVVVSSPYFFLPMLYYLRGDPACRLLRPGRRLLHYEGTAALSEADLIASSELAALAGERAWVVGNLTGRPSGWREQTRAAFYESYGVPGAVVVVCSTHLLQRPLPACLAR
ncbi:MAG TPA: glycosyltransferase family 39 protein [Pirellulales bacterium]|nr:glycosyltransferase family 39 protein [Pirellulales bacterium]